MSIKVKVVERPVEDVSYIRATLRGMGLTVKHLFDVTNRATIQYPEEKAPISPRWRGTHRMLTTETGKARFRSREQVITPVNQGTQCLLAGQRRPAAACEQVETVIQASCNLFDAQHRQTCCRQFDGQRDTIEPVRDLSDSRRILVRHGKRRKGG